MNQDVRGPDGDGRASMSGGGGRDGRGEAGRDGAGRGGGGMTEPPVLSLPKGGGAIRGIGETFQANPARGTASFTVPIATSPGRAGFGPALTLTYDSGAGNGPFGFGWSLSLPTIQRRTDQGLPAYRDAAADTAESDEFILSGAQNLVPVYRLDAAGDPVLDDRGNPVVHEEVVDGHTVRRYRPRVESAFARVERWTRRADGDTRWRTIGKDNVTTWFGTGEDSRVHDPDDPRRVFCWLISETYDDKGNAALYEYAREDAAGVDTRLPHERNRPPGSRTANRYVKRIRYGNGVSRLDPARPGDWRTGFHFEVVFDYGEDHCEPLPADPGTPAAQQHRYVRAAPAHTTPWTVRPDPFSAYRAGFEVRTYRRCHRVLMFHRFGELGDDPYLVRATEFDYADLAAAVPIDAELGHQGSTRFGSFLRSVTHAGFVRDDGRAVLERGGVRYPAYLRKALPPVEYEYRRPVVSERVRELDAGENLPAGVDGRSHQWLDLDGDGLSGVLTEQAGGWFYRPNLGQGRLGPAELVGAVPSPAALTRDRRFVDLAGDGSLDLVAFAGPTPGFHERTEDAATGARGWAPYRAFASMPGISWDEPNLRLVDLDGDGHADVLITEQDVFTWYPSLAEDGFGPARQVAAARDEERGPHLVAADGTESVYLADMSGDGLSDLVRVRDGEVSYWPNLGYGRFGAKVAMDGAPWFDHPDQFEGERIRLADIDGSGVTDIVYLGRDGVRLYFNRSGNGWSGPRPLRGFPPVDGAAAVVAADVLGTATTCLVWSSSLPSEQGRTVRYADLMDGRKPHLLVRCVNNLGTETEVTYAPSTAFALADRRAGRPWATRLPFPVHVVERVDVHDRVSGNHFVTRYAYHHGHFDGAEREFRGFGMVEQWDTEEFAALDAPTAAGTATDVDASSDVPPTLTRTWFHTGAFTGRDQVSRRFAGEYYREPALTDEQAAALLLDDTPLPAGLPADETREACRALTGSMLRREVYARDGSAEEERPYTVTEQNFTIRRPQPRLTGRHAVFHVHPRESVEYHYERDPADPRVVHTLTLAVDDFGTVTRSAVVAYGRRAPDPALDPADQERQAGLLITYTETDVTNPIDSADDHRAAMPAESRTYELTGLTAPAVRFTFDQVAAAATAAPPIAYETRPPPGVLRKRLVEHLRTLYRRDDLTGPLAARVLEARALPFEVYRLAFTPGLRTGVYGGRVTDPMAAEGGYAADAAGWWTRAGQVSYSPDPAHTPAQELAHARTHFFQPHRYRDPFGNDTFVAYDPADLLVGETCDPAGNRITAGERDADPARPLVRAGHDYRVLKPWLLMDPNRNLSAVAFDALGMVVATAVMGKPGAAPREGDLLEGFTADLTPARIAAHRQDPLTGERGLLGRATTCQVYDVLAFLETRDAEHPVPSAVTTLTRETHDADLTGGGRPGVQHSVCYSDGFGREVQKKSRAESDGGGPRWVGSGWTIFDDKGRPIRQFEPFFTRTHRFEFDVRAGVGSLHRYDPLGRRVATLHPDHTWEKVIFGAWRQETWDANDTVLIADPASDADVGDFFRRLPSGEYLPTWHAARDGGALGPAAQAAARKAAIHAGTPAVSHLDPLERGFLAVTRNRFTFSDTPPAEPPVEETYRTRVTYDIEGDQRAITDARGRVTLRLDYDMLGGRIHEASMDAGERWTLNDVAGKPLYAWDSRDLRLNTAYDPLRRPVEIRLREGAGAEAVVERTVYGETRPDPESANLRGKVYQRFDQAGMITSDDYDFKGNLRASSRRLAQDYASTLDWSSPVPLEATSYVSRTRYDALNRPAELITPDASAVRPGYNEAGLLERVEARLRGAAQATPFITGIDYDAKGQRTLVDYGNGVRTTYEYDPQTFRLVGLVTRRDPAAFPGDCPQPAPAGRPGCQVQSLHYTYDPAGNITRIRDDAQQAVFFRNRRVEPGADYTYDAVYRLIEATGREHLGQIDAAASYDDRPRTGLLHPHDGNAMGSYLERYRYDEVGNMLAMIHRSGEPAHSGWTRTFTYAETSLLDAAATGNRLTATADGGVTETYSVGGDGYDPHGGMLHMPHLSAMEWDFACRLRMTRRRRADAADDDGGQHDGERTYYVYDSDGTRVRKVTESVPGQPVAERLYLGGLEIHRVLGADSLVRETLHVMDGRRRVALVETRVDTASPERRVRYQFGDHLDSATLELDDQAQVISYEEFTPFGSTSCQAVGGQAEAAKRYRYTGKERDSESGLCYHGARYYAPWLARWTSADPVKDRQPVNLYTYVGNRPTSMVDPDGREGRSALSGLVVDPEASGGNATGTAVSSSGSSGGSSGGPSASARSKSGSGKKGGDGGGFFEGLANGLQSIADWIRDWLPGLVAAPLAGLVDILGGFTRMIGGIFSWKGDTFLQGLKEMGLGALSIVGLKEFVSEKWEKPKGLPTGFPMPPTIAGDLRDALGRAHKVEAWKNGWHAWHAGTNAAVANRLGPVFAPILWLFGLGHETVDIKSFQEEQKNQGTVNHILDSTMDIVANTFGILLGLLLPRKLAIPAAVLLGNYIPGPADPWHGQGGPYKGDPTNKWGPYFQ